MSDPVIRSQFCAVVGRNNRRVPKRFVISFGCFLGEAENILRIHEVFMMRASKMVGSHAGIANLVVPGIIESNRECRNGPGKCLPREPSHTAAIRSSAKET